MVVTLEQICPKFADSLPIIDPAHYLFERKRLVTFFASGLGIPDKGACPTIAIARQGARESEPVKRLASARNFRSRETRCFFVWKK